MGEVVSFSERAILRDVRRLLEVGILEEHHIWEPSVRPDWENPKPRIDLPELIEILRETQPRRLL